MLGMASDRADFVRQGTRLEPVPLLPEIGIYTTPDLEALWQSMAERLAEPELDPPFWAVPWVGGIALARYLLDHPEEVAAKRVVDFATGSGLCAIAAARAGAADVLAADIGAFSVEAVRLNALANAVPIRLTSDDLLASPPPETDVILAGDTWYDRDLAARLLAWLTEAHQCGIRILVGDMRREYFPRSDLVQLATYRVPTQVQLEGAQVKVAGVYTLAQRGGNLSSITPYRR